MNRLWKLCHEKLLARRFVRHVGILAGGTAVAQGLIVVSMPVLSRLYDPADFGVLAIYLAFVAIPSVTATFKYEQAIVLPRRDHDGASLLLVSVALAGMVGAGLWLILWLWGGPLLALVNTPELADWLPLVPVSIVALGVYQSFSFWCTRRKRAGIIGATRILQSVTVISIQLYAGVFLQAPVAGLIVAHVAGQLTAAAVLGARVLWLDGPLVRRGWQWRRMRLLALRYKKYPIYSGWPSLLNGLTLQLPALFFKTYFDATVTGYYFFVSRILGLPTQLIGLAMAQVFLQKVAETKSRGQRTSGLVERAFGSLLLIGLVYLAAVCVLSLCFGLVFGDHWRAAGLFALILAPSFVAKFVCSPLSLLFGVYDRQELQAAWKVVSLLVLAGTLAVSLSWGSFTASVIALSAVNVVTYAALVYMNFVVSESRFRNIFSFARRG